VIVAAKADGTRVLDRVRWGLVPSWAKDTSIGDKLINARADTLSSKPAYRKAFAKRRCLIPADGFYEWAGPTGAKQPFFVTVDSPPVAFAGLWEHWEGPDGELETCTIVTTRANQVVEQVHDRMPVILAKQEYDLWLDPETPLPTVESLLDPWPAENTVLYPVGKAVGNPRNEGPELLERMESRSLFD
jgi:putative SOS response-associated peptidase YedK